MQNYIENFHQTKDYDDFANYWAFFQCSGDYGSPKEVHPNLDITFPEEEFGGRLDLEADADDAQADTLGAEMRKPKEKGTLVEVDDEVPVDP